MIKQTAKQKMKQDDNREEYIMNRLGLDVG